MREEAKEFLENLNIAVIGLGLMGGSFAKRLRERTKCRITAFDRETETLNKALADGVIDAGYTEGNEELKKADLLIMCLSRDNMLSFLRQNAVYLREGQTLTDIIGIKGNSVEAAENHLPSGVDYVPAHPMAGREGFGYDMSRADIFDCANFTVGGEHLTSYTESYGMNGAETITDGVFYESVIRSAPYFDLRIDGITELTAE